MTVTRLAMLAAMFTVPFGCKRTATPASSAPPGTTTVVFAGSGIRVDPGPGFKSTGAAVAPEMVCLPTLAGPSGIVWALLLPPDRTEPAQAAAGLRAGYERDPASVPGSFEQSEFYSQSGLAGLLVTRVRRTESRGRNVDARSYSFLVPNGQGRCVAVDYLTTAEAVSPAVVESIRQSIARE